MPFLSRRLVSVVLLLSAQSSLASPCTSVDEKGVIAREGQMFSRTSKTKLEVSLQNKETKVFEDTGESTGQSRYGAISVTKNKNWAVIRQDLWEGWKHHIVDRRTGATFAVLGCPTFNDAGLAFVEESEDFEACYEPNAARLWRCKEGSCTTVWDARSLSVPGSPVENDPGIAAKDVRWTSDVEVQFTLTWSSFGCAGSGADYFAKVSCRLDRKDPCRMVAPWKTKK